MSKESNLLMIAAMLGAGGGHTIGFPRIKSRKKRIPLTDAEREERRRTQVKGKGAPPSKKKGSRKQRKERRQP